MNYLKDLFDQKSKRMNELEIRRIDKILTINGFKDFLKKMQIYFQLIFDSDVLYALAFIAFSLLGLFVHNFFFAFHLIEFIKTQPILRNVLQSTAMAMGEGFEEFASGFITSTGKTNDTDPDNR